MGTSVAGQLNDDQKSALPNIRDAMAAVSAGAAASTRFTFSAFFDGTNNDRSQYAPDSTIKPQSGDPLPTNVANLYELAKKNETDLFRVNYRPGIGTGDERGRQINAGVAPNAPANAIAEGMYQDFRNEVIKFFKNNPDATAEDVSVTTVGGSRGGAVGIKFAQMINDRDLVDDYGNVIAPRGSIPVVSPVFLDPVGRFVDGDLSLPANVRGPVLSIQALDENRSDFRPLDLSGDERVVTVLHPGNHVGVLGGYDQGGTASNVLEGVTAFMQNAGHPIADVPPVQRFDPTQKIKIYTEAYQTDGYGNVVTNEDGAPIYAWRVDDPAQGRQLDSPVHPEAMTEDQLAANSAALLGTLASMSHWSDMTDVQRAASFSALYNTVDHINSGELSGDLGGAASALSFVSALQRGNAGGVVVSGVSLANALGEDFASKEIASAMGMSGAASNVVPGLSLALAIDSGSSTAMLAAAANFIPVYGPLISVGISLFGGGLWGDDDIPMRQGLAHAQWDAQGQIQIITTQDAEGGGSTANSWMGSLVDGLQTQLQSYNSQHNASDGLGLALIPNLLPSVGFKYDPDGYNLANGARGFMYLQWTDDQGQTQTRFYDGAGNRGDDSGETLSGDFVQHAQSAIAPAWQVQTVLAHYQQSGDIDLPTQANSLPQALSDGLHQTLQVVSLGLASALPTEATPSNKLMDVDGDGYLEQTQWVQANQAILSVDLNGDGQISLGETVNLQDAGQVQQARTSLAWLDANQDARLTAQDPAFAAIRLWVDVNADGKGSATELQSLSQAGITAIDFSTNPPRIERADGSVQSLNVQTLTANTLGVGDARLKSAGGSNFNFIMANDDKVISDRSLDGAMNEALGNTAVAEATNEDVFRSAA